MLLRNRHNLKPEQAVHLKELLAAISRCYASMCCATNSNGSGSTASRPARKRLWGQWFRTEAAKRDRRLCKSSPSACRVTGTEIVARCRHPLNTSVVEGINNTIKVIKRRAYGYRDEQYFFLKIRAAFPGIPR
ncbi:transposase family protein [Burkholderia pseudomallei MSHR3016]|nr:transposase family protein [Burkholderia pseudomallei MSHR3016]